MLEGNVYGEFIKIVFLNQFLEHSLSYFLACKSIFRPS